MGSGHWLDLDIGVGLLIFCVSARHGPPARGALARPTKSLVTKHINAFSTYQYIMPGVLTVKLGQAAHFERNSPHDPQEERICKHLRVLVIEDTPFLLEHYMKKLGALDFIALVRVPAVKSLDEAFAFVNAHRPDIVITDLSLTSSHTEGFEILRVLKKHIPEMCVVATTSIYSPRNNDEVNEHLRASRFDAVFHKLDLDGLELFLKKKAIETTMGAPAVAPVH